MQDEAWKDVIEMLFPEFLAFFFPSVYHDIDFSRKPEFWDKELQRIIKKSKTGKRFADKLVKVYLKNNKEYWLLIHIEIQGYKEDDFTKRTFIYFYRIFDKFDKEIISLVIFADDNQSFCPNSFQIKRWGFNLTYQFPFVKLLDYKSKMDELENSENPFAIVVQSFLKTIETRGNDRDRYSWKKKFLIGLYDRGLTHDQVLYLYKFIDDIMNLPDDLENKLTEEIEEIEKEKTMAIVTSAERIGRKKGREEGEKIGEIKTLFSIKFGKSLLLVYPQVREIYDIKILEDMCNEVMNAKTYEEAADSISAQLSRWQKKLKTDAR